MDLWIIDRSIKLADGRARAYAEHVCGTAVAVAAAAVAGAYGKFGSVKVPNHPVTVHLD